MNPLIVPPAVLTASIALVAGLVSGLGIAASSSDSSSDGYSDSVKVITEPGPVVTKYTTVPVPVRDIPAPLNKKPEKLPVNRGLSFHPEKGVLHVGVTFPGDQGVTCHLIGYDQTYFKSNARRSWIASGYTSPWCVGTSPGNPDDMMSIDQFPTRTINGVPNVHIDASGMPGIVVDYYKDKASGTPVDPNPHVQGAKFDPTPFFPDDPEGRVIGTKTFCAVSPGLPHNGVACTEADPWADAGYRYQHDVSFRVSFPEPLPESAKGAPVFLLENGTIRPAGYLRATGGQIGLIQISDLGDSYPMR